MAGLENLTCEQWHYIVERLNHYFRNESVIEGTEWASTELGYAITAAYAVVIIFGAVGNLLTILAVVLNPAMRTTRNFFILNLALSDFFVCTVTAPITLYTIFYTFWPFGRALCKVAGSLQGFNIFLSTFSITAIALDRYVLVIFPTKRERQRNLSLLFFLLIWIVSLMLAVPLLVASDSTTIFEEKECGIALSVCHEQNTIWDQMVIGKKTYTLAVLITQYALPLISIVFVYTRIAHRMKMRFASRAVALPANLTSSQRRRSVVERQRRTHLLLVFVVAVFAAAWLPLNVFHLNNTFLQDVGFNVTIFSVCHVFGMFSACLNPLFYAFFNQNFRQEFASMFERVGFRALRQAFSHFDTKVTSTNAVQTHRLSTAKLNNCTFDRLVVIDRRENDEEGDEKPNGALLPPPPSPCPSPVPPAATRILSRQELKPVPAEQLVVMINTV